jgi:hypothetical protein
MEQRVRVVARPRAELDLDKLALALLAHLLALAEQPEEEAEREVAS